MNGWTVFTRVSIHALRYFVHILMTFCFLSHFINFDNIRNCWCIGMVSHDTILSHIWAFIYIHTAFITNTWFWQMILTFMIEYSTRAQWLDVKLWLDNEKLMNCLTTWVLSLQTGYPAKVVILECINFTRLRGRSKLHLTFWLNQLIFSTQHGLVNSIIGS